jgi:DUF2407 ubiquitin-like domain/DUF2407 C-terminal domain
MEMNGSSAGPSKPRHDLSLPQPNRPPGTVPQVPFHASIRFSSSALSDLEITIPNVNDSPPPTILNLKQQIRFLRPSETYNRRLRLILAGKVMNDHTPLKQIQSQLNRRPSVAPVSPSAKGKEKESMVTRIWIHCSMGEQLSDEEFEEDGREDQIQSTLPLPVGFDRLRSAGFSEEDIASLRTQFQRFHGSREEDEAVDATAMEERWLDETIGLGGGATTGDGGIATEGFC